MSDVKLTNLTSTETLPQNTVLRITWANAGILTSLIDTRAFSARFTALYEALASLHYGYPISPNPAIKDSNVAVIDFRLRKASTAAELINVFGTLIGGFGPNAIRAIDLVSIERLSDANAKIAASTTGAQQREAVKATEAERQKAAADSSNPFKVIAAAVSRVLGTTVKIAEGLLIVGLIVVVVVAAAKARHAASTLLHK